MAVRAGRVRLAGGAAPTVDDVQVVARLGFEDVAGVVVGVPLLPDELLADQARALAWMERAVQLAAPVGMVGLGSLLSVVAGRGEALAQTTGVAVTTGNAGTAWCASEVLLARLLDAGGAAQPVAVLGGRGTVGRAIAARLRARGVEVVLDPPELSAFRWVVGASTTGGLVEASALRPGTLLVDVALPPTLRGPPPPGVEVVPGECLTLPSGWRRDGWGHAFHVVAGYGHDSVYACLLEPLLAMWSGRVAPYASGRVAQAEDVEAFGEAAARAGFVPRTRAR
ncbi:MAG: Aminotransferase PigE [Pseudomonadota bacterium]|jgi:predicted amino acid dehydrogenase